MIARPADFGDFLGVRIPFQIDLTLSSSAQLSPDADCATAATQAEIGLSSIS
jgi:hypothetical protein